MGNGMVVKSAMNDVPLPEKYVKLGLMTGYNPLALEDARIYVTGLSGEGKTTFINSIPRNAVIDCEGGADGIPGRRSTYFNIKKIARDKKKTRYEVYHDILMQLLEDGKANKRYFHRITFDTHDAWAALVTRHLLEEKSTDTKVLENIGDYGQKGHGHSLVQGRMAKIIGDLEDVGYTWCIVGHTKYVTMPDPMDSRKEVSYIRPLLSAGYSGLARRLSELHITIQSTTRKEKEDKKLKGGRVLKGATERMVTRYHLYTRPSDSRSTEGKRRGVPVLPGSIEVPIIDGWKALEKVYNEAVEASRKKYEDIKENSNE